MMNTLFSPDIEYFNSNTICKVSSNIQDKVILYPIEFLNNVKFTGILNKEGVLVMPLQNLKQPNSLCNGTRIVFI